MGSKSRQTKQPVIITTEHRGVFFGYMDPRTVNDPTIRIEKARMCVYWDRSMKGIVGLASDGPGDSCRISPAGPAITLRSITSVMEVAPAAVTRWEAQPWQ